MYTSLLVCRCSLRRSSHNLRPFCSPASSGSGGGDSDSPPKKKVWTERAAEGLKEDDSLIPRPKGLERIRELRRQMREARQEVASPGDAEFVVGNELAKAARSLGEVAKKNWKRKKNRDVKDGTKASAEPDFKLDLLSQLINTEAESFSNSNVAVDDVLELSERRRRGRKVDVKPKSMVAEAPRRKRENARAVFFDALAGLRTVEKSQVNEEDIEVHSKKSEVTKTVRKKKAALEEAARSITSRAEREKLTERHAAVDAIASLRVEPPDLSLSSTSEEGEGGLLMEKTKPRSAFTYSPSGMWTSNGIGVNLTIDDECDDGMDLWRRLKSVDLERLGQQVPRTGFEEWIEWTKEGKMWRYPIDNEQDMGDEASVPFYEHVFLDHELEDFPDEPAVRHFMELVVTGLSLNPFMTVDRKREHIAWYRDYFTKNAELFKPEKHGRAVVLDVNEEDRLEEDDDGFDEEDDKTNVAHM